MLIWSFSAFGPEADIDEATDEIGQIRPSERRAASTRWISRSRWAGRPAAAEEDEDADDGQIGLHRRRQRRGGHAGQPRVLGLHGRIDRARPLRIVDVFRDEFGKENVADAQGRGRRARGPRRAQSMSLGPSAVMITLPG